MTARGISRADANKKIRQEALREQLAQQKHVEKVIDLLGKIEDLNGNPDLDSLGLNRLKAAIDTRMKLVGKYLPDLKAVEQEISGPNGSVPVFQVILDADTATSEATDSVHDESD